eukprot:362671-Chlamydomonas_euryale.AAC.2
MEGGIRGSISSPFPKPPEHKAVTAKAHLGAFFPVGSRERHIPRKHNVSCCVAGPPQCTGFTPYGMHVEPNPGAARAAAAAAAVAVSAAVLTPAAAWRTSDEDE